MSLLLTHQLMRVADWHVVASGVNMVFLTMLIVDMSIQNLGV
jgi:hypothetical protein